MAHQHPDSVDQAPHQAAGWHNAGIDPNFLLEIDDSQRWRRLRIALIVSAAFHLIFLLTSVQLESAIRPEKPPKTIVVKKTPLYMPPDLLTQRAPNKTKVAKQFELEDLRAAQPAVTPQVTPPVPVRKRLERPSKKLAQLPPPQPARPKQEAQKPTPEAPNLDAKLEPGPLPKGAQESPVAPPPPQEPVNKSPFENPGTIQPKADAPKIAAPRTSVQDVIKDLSHDKAPGKIVVTDSPVAQPERSIPGMTEAPPKMGGSLELQSDPLGVDFKPYLVRILSIVRRNWFTVIPESARLGTRRGRTIVQFTIERNGNIPKLVITGPSGAESLDRAAVAGLSMSNRLPPLPGDFRGAQINLAFSFSYNMPNDR